MTSNFLLSIIEQHFHYPTLLVTQCVVIAVNFSQIVDSSLGLSCRGVFKDGTDFHWRKLKRALDDVESILIVDMYGFYCQMGLC